MKYYFYAAVILLTMLLLSFTDAFAVNNTATRSPSTVAAFKRTHPCPATGRIQRSCPGYIVDHINPLCAGGLDSVANMQWQTVAAAHKKDLIEWQTCRNLRKQGK